MRMVIAAGRGVDPSAMTQEQHRKWLLDLDHLDADVVGFTEQWKPRYRRGVVKNLRGYGLALPFWPYGNGGTGLAWKRGSFSRLGYALARGGLRLHRLVRKGTRVISGYRSMRWVVLDSHPYQIAFGAAHLTPHPFTSGPAAREAWALGMGRMKGWARNEIAAGRRVAILVDANAEHGQMRRSWGDDLGGQPVRIISYGLCHVVLVGRWRVDRHGTLAGTPSDHRPLWVDATPVGQP